MWGACLLPPHVTYWKGVSLTRDYSSLVKLWLKVDCWVFRMTPYSHFCSVFMFPSHACLWFAVFGGN